MTDQLIPEDVTQWYILWLQVSKLPVKKFNCIFCALNLQWTPLNLVTNGSKKIGCTNGVARLPGQDQILGRKGGHEKISHLHFLNTSTFKLTTGVIYVNCRIPKGK